MNAEGHMYNLYVSTPPCRTMLVIMNYSFRLEKGGCLFRLFVVMSRTLLAVGPTGAGKSALLNFLLNKVEFKSALSPIAVTLSHASATSWPWSYVDTVGFCDADKSETEVTAALETALNECKEVHAICYVISARQRFSTETYN